MPTVIQTCGFKTTPKGRLLQTNFPPLDPAMPSLSDIFEELVLAASLAPSPDNNQPWSFQLEDERTIGVFHCKERALRSDVDGMFDQLGIGAAIENLTLRAAQLGWVVTVRDFAGQHLPGPLAKLHCEFTGQDSTNPVTRQLAESIVSRQTNRLPYSTQPIAAELTAQICHQAATVSGCRLSWIEDRQTMAELARAYAAADKIRFEQPTAHAELYSQLHFRPDPQAIHGSGLDVRTLELPLGAAGVLWQLRRWWLMQSVNRLGLTGLLVAPMQKLTMQSAALGVLIVKTGNRANEAPFLDGGRALQRSWLMAQALGIAVHPLGSVPIYLRVLNSPCSRLSTSQRSTLERIERVWQHSLQLAGGEIGLLGLRFGVAPPPRHRNLRLPVQSLISMPPRVSNSPQG